MFVNKSLEIVYIVRQLLCSAQTKITFYLRKTITYFIVLKYPLKWTEVFKDENRDALFEYHRAVLPFG